MNHTCCWTGVAIAASKSKKPTASTALPWYRKAAGDEGFRPDESVPATTHRRMRRVYQRFTGSWLWSVCLPPTSAHRVARRWANSSISATPVPVCDGVLGKDVEGDSQWCCQAAAVVVAGW